MVRQILTDTLNGHVEVEQQRALPVVAHHALNPEEGRDARAARHGADAMKAGRRVEDQVAGRQLDVVQAVDVLYWQLAAVVFVRRA